MMHYVFRLPDIGEGIAEAEITAWHVKPGEWLEEDHPMVDVMTDKATVEMTAPVSGRITALHGEIGQMVAIGAPLVELELDQEGVAPASATPTSVQAAPAVTAPPSGAPLASPATRKRSRELGIALPSVPGTGPEGRITAADLENFIARDEHPQAGTAAARTGMTETKITGLRRKIAERMEAAQRIPHFTYVEEFDLTELELLRKDLNENRASAQPKLTLLPFLMRGLVKLLPQFPQMNSHFDDEAGMLRSYDGIHIGIATQTPAGLLVPVVRHAETLGLWESARELTRVTAAARNGTAARDALTGSTITLTSLGALGGIAAAPLINHPEVAIIAPNRLVERPMAVNGQIAIRRMMNISASFDHRIIDGYDAAQFLQDLKRLLERPALLFLDLK
jgi:2-oxoisovalerate dehydrogenase E2 component (dihydrolipoyl transacylase)